MGKERSDITYRCAEADDLPFLYELYKNTRLDEVAGFGWGEAEAETFLQMQFELRRQAYKMQYPSAEEKIVLYHEEKAGSLLIDRTGSSIVIVDIAVAENWRRQGVASQLIRDLQEEAGTSRKDLVLRVDKTNDGAIALYERLGFEVESESQIMYSMIWRS